MIQPTTTSGVPPVVLRDELARGPCVARWVVCPTPWRRWSSLGSPTRSVTLTCLISWSPHTTHLRWPTVSVADWERLKDESLRVLERLKQGARNRMTLDRGVSPVTQDELGWTVGSQLTCSVATQAASPLGPIVVIRCLRGVWED